MAKNLLVKFFVPFLLMWWSHNASNVCAYGTKDQLRMLKRVTQENLWQPLWFNEFGGMPKDTIWRKDSTAGMMAKLRMVSPMMGCVYGVFLHWFLELTLVSIDTCNQLSPPQDESQASEDCRSRVSRSIEKGRRVIVKLMRTLQYVHSVILDDIDQDRFYQQLSQLDTFYTGQTTEKFTGVVPGGLEFNNLLKSGSESLADYMLSTCTPHYPTFDIRAMKDVYATRRHTHGGIYLFYVSQLDSYTAFINEHLTKLRITPW